MNFVIQKELERSFMMNDRLIISVASMGEGTKISIYLEKLSFFFKFLLAERNSRAISLHQNSLLTVV